MYVSAFSYLAFPTEPPEQLVRFEFRFLIGHDPGHLEDEPRLGLVVQPYGVEGQHP